MAITCRDGLKDCTRAKKMYREALVGYERSLGQEN